MGAFSDNKTEHVCVTGVAEMSVWFPSHSHDLCVTKHLTLHTMQCVLVYSSSHDLTIQFVIISFDSRLILWNIQILQL
jgi:hypothetical protein